MGRHWGDVTCALVPRLLDDSGPMCMPARCLVGPATSPSGEPSVELRCRRRNRDVAEDHEVDRAGGGSPIGRQNMTGDASIRGPLKTMSVLVNEDGCHGQI